MKITWRTFLASLLLILAGNTGLHAADWKIKTVTFTGNKSYRAGELQKVMVTRPYSIFYKSQFNPEILKQDLEQITRFYMENGWLDAHILSHRVERDKEKHAIHIHIQIDEGEPWKVESIEFLGNHHYSDSLLSTLHNLKKGNLYKSDKVYKAALDILTFYGNHGFLNAEVLPDMKMFPVRNRVVIAFQIEEDRPYRFKTLEITGIKKTRPEVIKRELLLKSEDLLSYESLMETQRHLYLSGIFNQVFVKPVDVEEDVNHKNIHIEVEEKSSVDCHVALGFGTHDRLRGRFELAEINLAGKAQKLALSAKASFIYRGLSLAFTEPRTFGSRWKTDMNISTQFKEEPGYDLLQYGGQMQIGREVGRLFRITGGYQYLTGQLNHVSVESLPEDIETRIRSFRLGFSRDRRDNLFNTKNGYYIELNGEIGAAFTDKVNEFVRVTGNVKFFKTLFIDKTLGTSAKLGWMNSAGKIQNIPLNERFYAGGPNSVRGFAYQKLGPTDSDHTPIGGRLFFTWHIMELRFPLYRWFGCALFWDTGQVWEKGEDLNWETLRHSPGLGLRINTPIGTIRTDLAWNYNPAPHENEWRFHFQIGQIF